MSFSRRFGRLPQRLKITYSLIVLVVLASIGVFIWATLAGKIKPFAAAGEAELYLSPGQSYELGQTFGAPLNINTSGVEVSDIAVRSLHYNSLVLEVIDSDSGASGIQIAGDSLGGLQTIVNSVDPGAGKITYEIKIPDTNTPGFTGSARIALIGFRAIQAGRADFSFDFVSGQTGDTDVIAKDTGNDILVSAPLAFLTINDSSGPGGQSPSTGNPTPRQSSGCVKGCSPTPTSQVTPTEPPVNPEESPSPTEIVPGPTSTSTPTAISVVTPTPETSISAAPTSLISSPEEPIIMPTASAVTKLAGFAISSTLALTLYIGVPVLVVLIVFLIWWWRKKKRIEEGTEEAPKGEDEIDDDEMI